MTTALIIDIQLIAPHISVGKKYNLNSSIIVLDARIIRLYLCSRNKKNKRYVLLLSTQLHSFV